MSIRRRYLSDREMIILSSADTLPIFCPSTQSIILSFSRGLSFTSGLLSVENIIVLEHREWGQMGVICIHSRVGSSIGPPADNAYAVEPVGVEKISPSALMELTSASLT